MNLFGKKSPEPTEEAPGRPKLPHSPSGGRSPQGGLGGHVSHDDVRYPVRKSDAEWRAQLGPQQYQVARQAATERPFTGQFWDHWADGAYR